MRAMLILGAAALSLAGCDTPDRAIFATSTNIGVNADAATRTLSLGYDRTEGFAGPAYVDTGAVPSAVGFIQSNLEVFSPRVKQLYATGKAADLVTASTLPAAAEQPDPMEGDRRLLVFGTTNSIGLKLGFDNAAGLPDSVSFGYKRKELSVIPLRRHDPAKPEKDEYASVLASVDMNLTGEALPTTDLRVVQFVATGMAARQLARSDDIRGLFHQRATAAMTQAQLDARAVRQRAVDLVSCVSGTDGAIDAAKLSQILDGAVAAKAITANQKALFAGATTARQLKARMVFDEGATRGLQGYVQSDADLCAG